MTKIQWTCQDASCLAIIISYSILGRKKAQSLVVRVGVQLVMPENHHRRQDEVCLPYL